MGSVSNGTLNGFADRANHAAKEKPIILGLAFPSPGHIQGMVQVSTHLVSKGYKVFLIGYEDYQTSIEKGGAEFIRHPWRWVLPDPKSTEGMSLHDKLVSNLKFVFVDATPAAFSILKDTLERLRVEYPGRQVIVLYESLAQGVLPFMYGAPLPKGFGSMPKVINFSTTMDLSSDPLVPPFGPGLPYNPTEENIQVWKNIYDARVPSEKALNKHYDDTMRPLGATISMEGWLWDTSMRVGDITLLPTSASTDYPRQTKNPKIRYIGGLPLKPMNPDFVYPGWWSEITSNAALPASSSEKKKVVMVAQGTAMLDYSELIVPTIKALASRDNVILVATLGKRGASIALGEGEDPLAEIPANTKVIDYLPYDALLPYADVFICNAGYGGFMHGVMNGVPMVLAGTQADKAEVAARAEYVGVAVNLRATSPTPGALRAGIDKVLSNESYKNKAVELKAENEAMDAMGQIEKIVDEFTE
ncbi:glycosyltransferase family 1 protein [Lasiosphaeria miniovina]|uniref:Glycosyltransferase family 1 protein n=1 Tax=Lasiosphaeria miniovina TaxID=1954250 RepID=A0AA39ZZ11_9PEZI|nr:glycosyltransferase family 1 protein [Lasiosphaeria miniovina]KAK0706185.1 glycosyltransferase family 1 protein [Lasiosphaeria miniovina]